VLHIGLLRIWALYKALYGISFLFIRSLESSELKEVSRPGRRRRTFRWSLWPSSRLRHSLKSTLATDPTWQMQLTRQVHSQKFPLKNITLSPRPHGSMLMPHRNSSCAVVWRAVTRISRKMKAPVVKQKLFELERKVWRFFQADQKRGPVDYPSLRWREKSSSGFKFWWENHVTV